VDTNAGQAIVPETIGQQVRGFAEISRLLTGPGIESLGVAESLARVAHAAVDMVEGAEVVSVTLRLGDGTFTTPAHTDPLATRVDEAQYEVGEGPCVTATATPGFGVAYHPDLQDSSAVGDRWPRWAPKAVELGVRCVLSTGIYPADDPPREATVNYYSSVPYALDHADRDTAMLLASFAGVVLHHSAARTAAELEVANLRKAIAARDVIGQAKGILMERRGYNADQAFETLRHASRTLNIKLRDVAAILASRRTEL
jgi:ANTAR domain